MYIQIFIKNNFYLQCFIFKFFLYLYFFFKRISQNQLKYVIIKHLRLE